MEVLQTSPLGLLGTAPGLGRKYSETGVHLSGRRTGSTFLTAISRFDFLIGRVDRAAGRLARVVVVPANDASDFLLTI